MQEFDAYHLASILLTLLLACVNWNMVISGAEHLTARSPVQATNYLCRKLKSPAAAVTTSGSAGPAVEDALRSAVEV